MKSVFATAKGIEYMADERHGDSSHERAGELEPQGAGRGNSPRGHDTDSESVNTPWIELLIVGLLLGTILGRLIDDVTVGTASGVAGACVIGSLWAFEPLWRQAALNWSRG